VNLYNQLYPAHRREHCKAARLDQPPAVTKRIARREWKN
jgi:hypothetical protein